MIRFNNLNLIPIGCSCINHYQLDFNFLGKPNAKRKGGLFDWSIASPQSTLEIFQAIADGTAHRLFTGRDNYELEQHKRLKNTAFESFYFWHEDGPKVLGAEAEFEAFQSKVVHLIDNLLQAAQSESNVLLWSNIQPNLQSVVSPYHSGWNAYKLNSQQYENISTLATYLFGKNSRCIFISREEDCEFPGLPPENVVIMQLERSENFRGAVDLYSPIFRSILKS